MKRIIALVLALSSLLCGCMKTEPEVKGLCNIKAAVFGSEFESGSVCNELKNGIMANLDVDMLSVTDNLSEYDIVYLDSDAISITISSHHFSKSEPLFLNSTTASA